MSGVLEHSFAGLLVDICVAGAVLGSFYHLTAIILVLGFPRARKETSLVCLAASHRCAGRIIPAAWTSSAGYSRRMTPPSRWFVCCKQPVVQRSS